MTRPRCSRDVYQTRFLGSTTAPCPDCVPVHHKWSGIKVWSRIKPGFTGYVPDHFWLYSPPLLAMFRNSTRWGSEFNQKWFGIHPEVVRNIARLHWLCSLPPPGCVPYMYSRPPLLYSRPPWLYSLPLAVLLTNCGCIPRHFWQYFLYWLRSGTYHDRER